MSGAVPAPLARRIARLPRAHDPATGADVLGRLGLGTQGPAADLLRGAAGSAPYLARLMLRHADWLGPALETAPEDSLRALLDGLGAEAEAAPDSRALGTALRLAKGRAALLVALADLSGAWDLAAVTAALSDMAETAVGTALRWLLAEELRRGRLPGLGPDDLATGAGYCVIAMGKLGARELNYSSDIDLICLFDQDRFEPADFAEAKARYIKVTRGLVQLLSDQTDAGYVFRTDLRLRPSPSTTPVCMAMEAAERYYESVGRTWERAAHIKARTIAGDMAAGAAYLDRLTPFVWRRHLDFAAIEDTQEMLRKIREKKGKFTPEGLPGHDVKLGPGGIREIEFFAQTRQLISGGREPRLRLPGTVAALAALADCGWIGRDAAGTLSADYAAHRELEHRLQMVEDAQTQTIPLAEDARARVAALSGWEDRRDWERDIAERLARVHRTSEAFFTTAPARRGHRALDEDAGVEWTAEASEDGLARLGFARPADAARIVERWRSGSLPATRTSRARRLFAGLEGRILAALAAGGSPDEAMAQFDRFLSGLPAGVQVFSLFTANPHLLDLIVGICAVAPRLAVHLGREPAALDALLAPDFFEPLPGAAALAADLERWLAREDDYERVLDAARAWARETRFRAGVQVLQGIAEEAEAGAAFSAIAEACLRVLLPRVVAEFARRHGPPPGNGLCVIAMGKLGSREMTAGSDLDLITVYDPGEATQSDGPRPLSASAYYPRLIQAVLAALTAPTAQGRLYEVDMRLRPSGRQGPVATSLKSFGQYQREKAWVWEHLAMTRARVVAEWGTVAEGARAEIAAALAARNGTPEVMAEARAMRGRLLAAHAADRANPWSLKHAAGGLMEIEFLAQTGVLLHGLAGCRSAGAALPRLARAGWISAQEAEALEAALGLMQRLQQIERVALDHPFDPDRTGAGLKSAMARATGHADFATLEAALRQAQADAAAVAERVFAEPETQDGAAQAPA